MTADDITPPATDDHSDLCGQEQIISAWAGSPLTAYEQSRSNAELFLQLAAKACEPEHGTDIRSLSVEQQTVLAQVGTGYAKLAAIDHATQQANAQAKLLGTVLEAFQGIVASAQSAPTADFTPADFIVDRTNDVWTHTGNGMYESRQDSGLYDVTGEHIREVWAPVREYVLRPSTPDPRDCDLVDLPAQEADGS